MPENPTDKKSKKEDSTKRESLSEGIELWEEVCRDISPLKGKERQVADGSPLSARQRHPAQDVSRRVADSFPRADRYAGGAGGYDPSSRQVDAALATRLRRGDMRIDGRIDLHDMTESLAYRKFSDFMADRIRQGARCLLVITGKGRNRESGAPEGVLRRALPLWLNEQPFAPFVLSCVPAPARLGGAGAFLVLLRRPRSEP